MLDAKIETFLKVVELKSYTTAAEALHLTQPAVTQHIRKLEAHYGHRLIDSSKRSVQVTEAGEMLYRYLSLQRANEARFVQLLQSTVKPLRVGATLSIADYYLPGPLLNRMLHNSDPVRVTVGNTTHLLEQLRTGELDCAFIEGLFDALLFETLSFCQATFLPVVRSGHPLLGSETTLAALHTYPLALREPHSGTREVLETWLRQQDDGPLFFAGVVELGSFTLIKEWVRRTDAITFVYEGVVREELARGDLCQLPLAGFPLTHALRFVYRRGDARHQQLEQFFRELV